MGYLPVKKVQIIRNNAKASHGPCSIRKTGHGTQVDWIRMDLMGDMGERAPRACG